MELLGVARPPVRGHDGGWPEEGDRRTKSTIGHPGAGSRGSAFTLVELLVVVAIIALLVSILLPTLNRAKEAARQVYCMNNLRNMIIALHTYNTAWGAVPYNYCDADHAEGAPDDGLGRWALGYLSRYLGGPLGMRRGNRFYENKLERVPTDQLPKVYFCPSASPEVFQGANITTVYHACYFSNPAVRVNQGWENWLASANMNPDVRPLIYDGAGPGGAGSGCLGRLHGKSCPDGWHWRSVYHPTIDSMPVTSQIAFAGDTNNNQNTGLQPILSRVYPPGDWYIQPGFGPIAGSLGFDRHLDKLMLGYCDQHAAPFEKAALMNWGGWWNMSGFDTGSTGDFLVKYPPGAWGCTSAGRQSGLHLMGQTVVSGIR